MRSRIIKTKHILVLAVLVILSLLNTYVQTQNKSVYNSQQEISQNKVVYRVIKVVDGDTVDVASGTSTMRIRLIGINAPESVDPRRNPECYGKEASNILSTFLSDREVSIIRDSTTGNKDVYNRELAYIVDENNVDVGEYMIEHGAAREYTYKGVHYDKRNTYIETQKRAKQMMQGLWNREICTH